MHLWLHHTLWRLKWMYGTLTLLRWTVSEGCIHISNREGILCCCCPFPFIFSLSVNLFLHVIIWLSANMSYFCCRFNLSSLWFVTKTIISRRHCHKSERRKKKKKNQQKYFVFVWVHVGETRLVWLILSPYQQCRAWSLSSKEQLWTGWQRGSETLIFTNHGPFRNILFLRRNKGNEWATCDVSSDFSSRHT